MRRIERGFCVSLVLMAAFGATAARAEPPVRSPQDATCRAEARARVFSTPNPRNLPIEELGKGIYFACMDRIAPKAKSSRRRSPRRGR